MTYISSILTNNKKFVKIWSRNAGGERAVKRFDAPYFFYVPDKDGKFSDLYGNKLTRLDFTDFFAFQKARKTYTDRNVVLCESDIKPENKVLSEQFYGSEIGDLHITFLDIEVDYDKNRGFSSPTNPYAPINSVALYHCHTDETIVLVVPPKNRAKFKKRDIPQDIKDEASVTICKNEAELLKLLFEEFDDSDIISGWNSDFFDLPYIYERANKVLYKGAGNKLCFNGTSDPYYRDVQMYGNINKKLVLHGRVGLDYLDLYKKFEMAEKPSYKLEHVAEDELPDLPKISYAGSLYDLYRNNFEEFIRYNIRDTVILKGLEEKKRYIKLSVQISHMATTPIPDVLGTIKVAEQSIINYCHYEMGKQVPDHTPPESSSEKYDGATVITPKVGMHEWTASVDLQSLYPGIMRSLNISPESIMGQFADGNRAFELIREGSDEPITFLKEHTNKSMNAPANKWPKMFGELGWTISAAGTAYNQNHIGVIPSILTTWFDERKEFKKKMWEAGNVGDKTQREYYDRMQYIKKIQLNAMYGACGNRFFKFFDTRMPVSVTLSGREVLLHMAKTIAKELTGAYDMESDAIVYGDTDSVYFKTYEDNAEDAFALANEVCKTINTSYPAFMEDTFFCDETHNWIMKAEQEVIASRGIYVGKKYYMLHVVYNDGEPVDKMKFMGVPIKKTTLPKAIKNKLSTFIERLLRGEDWDIIGPEIVGFKDELMEMEDIRGLGSPKGINKLEHYTERFNAKEEKLRLPGHVSAAILWNKCLQSYGDKESQRITSGSKLSVFYLTSPIGRFKSIAVPVDLDVLPPWFVKHFIPIIDRGIQIEKLVDRPMEIMISVAGIKVPTKKKLLFEEGLFE